MDNLPKHTYIRDRRSSLTPPLVIEVHVQIPESERSCTCVSGYQICLFPRFPNSSLLNNEERDSNYSLKHLRRCVYVADIRHTFYNVRNLYDLFTYVAEDTTLKFFKEINL